MCAEDLPLVDPPIDDESFRQEASSMPSDEQRHVMYTSYTLTLSLSRFFEIISILLMAFSFSTSLIPITVYSLLVLFASLFNERFILNIVGSFRSKLNLMNFILAGNRIYTVSFCALLLIKDMYNTWYYKLFIFLGITLSTVMLKLSLVLFQLTFRNDWLRVLSNSQQSVRVKFEQNMHAWSVMMSLLFPIVSGLLMSKFSAKETAKLLIYGAILGFLVEISLFYRLHSTCYALHLPRSRFSTELVDNTFLIETHPMIGVLTTPTISASPMAAFHYSLSSKPLSRILSYVKRKPVPVLVTFGVQLINVSLLTIGPHMVWFLLRNDISPAFVGTVKMLQTLFTLHPAVSARTSFTFTCIGCITALVSLGIVNFAHATSSGFIYIFAFSVVLARVGVPTINLIGEQFVENYLADDEVYKLYKENAAWLGTQCEMAIHVLTIIWPRKSQFFWPMSISAFLMISGMAVVLHVIRKYLNAN